MSDQGVSDAEYLEKIGAMREDEPMLRIAASWRGYRAKLLKIKELLIANLDDVPSVHWQGVVDDIAAEVADVD